jgi:monoamine oxidase
MHIKTIIVGGGSAGMSCALRLKETGQEFLLLTDVLGGRICYSEGEKVNFGAYFVMSNYRFAKRLTTRRTWINPLSVTFHNSDTEWFNTISLHTIGRLPQLLRFYLSMWTFIRHYTRYKERCLVMTQREAMAADRYIEELFHKPAAQFIREMGFEKAAHDYVSKFSYACTGVDMENITALDMMNCCMGLAIPIYRFSFDSKDMERRLGGQVEYAIVIEVEKRDRSFKLKTADGEEYTCDHLVLATPAVVTQKLLDIPGPLRQTCKLYVYHIDATLKPKYATKQMNVFPFESEIVFTAVMDDGSYLVYTRENDERLMNRVCYSYKMIGMKAWDKAMYVYGQAYVEQQYGDRLYVAGDHNGLGQEPPAISGTYAANQIIKRGQE